MKKKEQLPIRTNEAVIAGWVDKLFGIPPSGGRLEIAMIQAEEDSEKLCAWCPTSISLYPWQTNLMQVLWNPKITDQIVADLVVCHGDVVLVNDTGQPGINGLWVVLAEQQECTSSALYVLENFNPKMVVNNFLYDGDAYRLVGAHFPTCIR